MQFAARQSQDNHAFKCLDSDGKIYCCLIMLSVEIKLQTVMLIVYKSNLGTIVE